MNIQSIVLRKPELGDIETLSALHVASWKGAYQGLLPEAFLAQHARVDIWIRIWGNILKNPAPNAVILIAEAEGRLLGYFNGGPTFSEGLKGHATAEVHGLYLHPDSQGKGIGSQLFRSGLQGLGNKGFSSAALWVFSGNPAVEFYRKRGGRELEIVNRELEVGGTLIPRRFFYWRLKSPIGHLLLSSGDQDGKNPLADDHYEEAACENDG